MDPWRSKSRLSYYLNPELDKDKFVLNRKIRRDQRQKQWMMSDTKFD